MSNEVVKPGDARVLAFMQAGKETVAADPEAAQLDIVRRILSGDTPDEVLTQAEAMHSRDVLGESIIIDGFRYQESDLEGGGIGFYMLLDCVTPQGEPYVVTCGAVNVMAQLHRLAELGALPGVFSIVEMGKPTKRGYKPMWLQKGVKPQADAYDPFAKEASF